MDNDIFKTRFNDGGGGGALGSSVSRVTKGASKIEEKGKVRERKREGKRKERKR